MYIYLYIYVHGNIERRRATKSNDVRVKKKQNLV